MLSAGYVDKRENRAGNRLMARMLTIVYHHFSKVITLADNI